MRTLAVLFGAALVALGQPAESSAPVRGIVLERDSQPAGGEFSIRTSSNFVYRFQFDPHTRVERQDFPIDVPRLKPGEQVEVDADGAPGPRLRYARSVRVITPLPPEPHHRTLGGATRPYDAEAERLLRLRGDMSFSGVVARLSDARLVLHTRAGGEQTILLRSDTRYVENGEIVTATELKPTTVVNVRAGKTPYGDVEGFQVTWGRILEPR